MILNAMQQLNLFDDTYAEDEYSREKYIITDSNEQIFNYLCNLNGESIEKFCLLSGPKFSGKTHLSRIFAETNGGVIVSGYYSEIFKTLDSTKYLVIDQLENFEEQVAFEIFNYCKLKQKVAIFICNSEYICSLPDLKSRIFSLPRLEIPLPDEKLLSAIIFKILADRQIFIEKKLLEFAAKHLPRTFFSAKSFAEIAITCVTKNNIKLTIFSVKKILEQMYL